MNGNELVITFDLGTNYFVHAVLYVADIWPESLNDTYQYWPRNVEIYVGDDPSYTKN